MQQDDIDRDIEDFNKVFKNGSATEIQIKGQQVDIKLKAQQNQLNKIVIENLNKSNELLAGLQQEIQRSTKSVNDSNKALSDQQSSQNKWTVACNVVLAIVSIFSLGVAWESVHTANLAASQTTNVAMAQLRPYVVIEPVNGGVAWIDDNNIQFKILMKNIGQTPASKILKGYNSYLLFKDGTSKRVQPFREQSGDEDALAPTQISAEQPLKINVEGFIPKQGMSIKVEVFVSYEGFHEIDSKRYLSKAVYVITVADGYIFVSQPKLAFGYVQDGWAYK